MATHSALEQRLGKAGFLVAAGLIVEIAASALIHPLAFVAFVLVACPLVIAGMLLFLWALVASA
jgi:hypothetical protein